ncbi:hypothetical protein FLK61_24330 [Paenalkalicoccus suaedae]|uniref:Uncharacterized protein n=1 Tax=Paenalkalicoccus suaedae TaxID=2592382 RepID=A0A859FAV6_9BACI|nr:hypothetical protein [Paenalkalicoccus suaedae]QKS69912.1 hypothetical protein FLK61_24330 [Paenalkalicoccus suaedae]
MVAVNLLLLPLFVLGVLSFLVLSTKKSSDKKESEHALQSTYSFAIPILPIGWLCIELFHRFIQPVSLATYREFIWTLVMLTFIVVGIGAYMKKRSVKSASV